MWAGWGEGHLPFARRRSRILMPAGRRCHEAGSVSSRAEGRDAVGLTTWSLSATSAMIRWTFLLRRSSSGSTEWPPLTVWWISRFCSVCF